MEFRPRFDQSLLPARQRTRKQLHRVNTEDSNFILTVRAEMRNMMFGSRLNEHANDDAEESA
jgi:hypothetical protein